MTERSRAPKAADAPTHPKGPATTLVDAAANLPVGGAPSRALPFRLEPPIGKETPVIVEVPHASVHVPASFVGSLVDHVRSMGMDADLLVDELYEHAPAVGATLLVAQASRYVVDLNRAVTDVDGESVQGERRVPRLAHGLIWRRTTQGAPVISRPLSPEEFRQRLDALYKPYHAALQGLIASKMEKFGFAVILAAHSMPSQGPTLQGGPLQPRADVVPGTRGRSSASGVFIDAVEATARDAGYSVCHDDPYRGGFTTAHYGRPADRVHVVQVELSRRLYMDEAALVRHEGFETTQAFCTRVVERLGTLTP